MEKTRKQFKHRISVNNFVASVNEELFGILNERMLERWYLRVWPIGGGARLRDKDRIKRRGGFNFEKRDARFQVQQDKVQQLQKLFVIPDPTLFETTIERELYEELCFPGGALRNPEIHGHFWERIIPMEKLERGLLHTEHDPEPIAHTARSKWHEETLSHYVRHLHHIKVTDEVFDHLRTSNHLYHITQEVLKKGYVEQIPIFRSLARIYEQKQKKFWKQSKKLTDW